MGAGGDSPAYLEYFRLQEDAARALVAPVAAALVGVGVCLALCCGACLTVGCVSRRQSHGQSARREASLGGSRSASCQRTTAADNTSSDMVLIFSRLGCGAQVGVTEAGTGVFHLFGVLPSHA